MLRLRMANLPELGFNLSNEVIDLTGDSPVNRTRIRSSRARRISAQLMRTNLLAQNLHEDVEDLSFANPLHGPNDHGNSSVQMIDADDLPLIVRTLQNERQARAMNAAKLNEEYSTTVPCILDSYNGEQVVLSCPICFEPLIAECKPMATSCGHIFCATCLKQTFQGTKNKTCPKCNGPVKLKSCIRLYL